jgi:quercetin dioxygenase-like cupin family protein
MAVDTYLDGALTIETLGGDSAVGLFRAEDARGGVAWLARGEAFSYLHAVEFRSAGDRRGFHVHAGHRERLYVFSGTVRLLAARGGERVDLPLGPGTMMTFEPGVAHGLIAETPAFAVSFGSGTDPIADTTACPELD